LYRWLKSKKIEAWLDEEKLLPGQDWQHEIPKAVREADVVIVCLSRGSTTKTGYVQKEIKYALDVADEQPEGGIFIIPAKLEECDIPDRLKRLHCVNLFEKSGYPKLLQSLQVIASKLESVGVEQVSPQLSDASPAQEEPNIQLPQAVSQVQAPHVKKSSSKVYTPKSSGIRMLVLAITIIVSCLLLIYNEPWCTYEQANFVVTSINQQEYPVESDIVRIKANERINIRLASVSGAETKTTLGDEFICSWASEPEHKIILNKGCSIDYSSDLTPEKITDYVSVELRRPMCRSGELKGLTIYSIQ
jgi:hypothetical protein